MLVLLIYEDVPIEYKIANYNQQEILIAGKMPNVHLPK